METLEIKKADAIKAYGTADSNLKKVLEALFGKENLLPQNITDRIKTFKDACEYFNIKTHGDAYRVLKLQKRKLLADVPIEQCDDAVLRLMIQIHALNEGVFLDLADTNQAKYMPYFKMVKDSSRKSGFALSYLVCACGYAHSYVGLRLCLHTSENAVYAGKQFLADYEEYFIPEN